MSGERNILERIRIRLKRADPAYLQAERRRNSARMRAVRAKGLCHDCCKRRPQPSHSYCARCLKADRIRRRRKRAGA